MPPTCVVTVFLFLEGASTGRGPGPSTILECGATGSLPRRYRMTVVMTVACSVQAAMRAPVGIDTAAGVAQAPNARS